MKIFVFFGVIAVAAAQRGYAGLNEEIFAVEGLQPFASKLFENL